MKKVNAQLADKGISYQKINAKNVTFHVKLALKNLTNVLNAKKSPGLVVYLIAVTSCVLNKIRIVLLATLKTESVCHAI